MALSGNDKKKKLIPLGLGVIALAVLLYTVWYVDKTPSSDDAYAYADTVEITPEVPGRIITLNVRDNQLVKKGDLLFEIDPRPFVNDVARAEATLVALDKQIEQLQRTISAQKYGVDSVKATVESARAAANQATDTLARLEPLLKPGYVSAEEVDRARTAQRSALSVLNAAEAKAQEANAAIVSTDALQAQRSAVVAEVAQAKLRLEWSRVSAPFNGRVVSLKTTVGQYATALKPVFTLIDTEHWYVIANFRETDLDGVRPGVPASVYLLGNTGKRFQGVVDSVGYGVLPDDGGLVISGLPRVQRTLNWVHVSQRYPIKILIENPDPELFRIGASASVALKLPKSEAKP